MAVPDGVIVRVPEPVIVIDVVIVPERVIVDDAVGVPVPVAVDDTEIVALFWATTLTTARKAKAKRICLCDTRERTRRRDTVVSYIVRIELY